MTDTASDEDKRPSPDALLEQAEQEARGKLKIFLGAAPGVGKTYEMLSSGRARKMDRVDVVTGIVETHGRAETRAMARGFETIPRQKIGYKGQELEEMDLDAILARHPELVLVDELAHTNAPGSRHPKRYQDVLEILDNGIDVYTTLNIQHVESLNDVVAQITRIRVRETVPDSVIDRADDIEIIDITPADLIKRLNEGKVYLPKTAHRAIRNYFSAGNLTALRELALRRTAQRVDQQLVNHMQANAIHGPWPSGDRFLVCVDQSTHAPALVRYTKRQSDRMRAAWAAIYIERPQAMALDDAAKDRIAATLRLAEGLGAETVTLPGQNVASEVLRYARASNYSHIITGRTGKSWWREILEGSTSRDLVRGAGDISVHIISANEKADRTQRTARTEAGQPVARVAPVFSLRPYFYASIYTAVALGLGKALAVTFDVQNIALVFLMAVMVSATTLGLWPALFTSVLGAVLFNFFFLSPTYTLNVGTPESVVALGFFFGAALMTSNLTARVHRQAAAARDRARTTESLYLFAKRLSAAGTLDDVLWASVNQIATMLHLHTVILLPEGNTITVKAGFPPDDTLAESDIAAAHWAWEHDRPAGRSADTLPGAQRLYLPLRTGRRTIGVLGLDNDKTGPLLTPDQQRLLDALADQAALAIERIRLVEDLDHARLAAEADKLRSALLTSISHDLRTPLAGVMGAAGTLRDYSDVLSAEDRSDLLTTITQEADRLNRFISNLLDMTRIEAGVTAPNSALVDISETVGAVLQRASDILKAHKVERHLAPDLPMLRIDPVLMEQVLFNLLDNAAKYTPAGGLIRVGAWEEGANVRIEIADQGPGIPPADLSRIFDMFYRVRKEDKVTAGTGLGLAICKGFVDAMGGTIAATNGPDGRGAVFHITFPIPTDLLSPKTQG